jgi:PhzF family phenazine biosynthesis protein
VNAADLSLLEKILERKPRQEPFILNVGPRWLVAELANADAVDALLPDMADLAELSVRLEIGGVTVYGAANDGKSDIHVRSFAPAHGIPEDPVCGSGNISVAAYRRMARQVAAGAGYVARQGMQLGRDGQVSIRYEGDKILLGGSAVTCVEGTLRLA